MGFELLVGLSAATNSESDPVIKEKIVLAQVMTVISWCTYPVVYLFPMLGIAASNAVVAIQVGYCVSDIISKCGRPRDLSDHLCKVEQRGPAQVRAGVFCTTSGAAASFQFSRKFSRSSG